MARLPFLCFVVRWLLYWWSRAGAWIVRMLRQTYFAPDRQRGSTSLIASAASPFETFFCVLGIPLSCVVSLGKRPVCPQKAGYMLWGLSLSVKKAAEQFDWRVLSHGRMFSTFSAESPAFACGSTAEMLANLSLNQVSSALSHIRGWMTSCPCIVFRRLRVLVVLVACSSTITLG